MSEVYNAQKRNPTEGDFCILLKYDAKDVNLKMNEADINTTNEVKYKEVVKTKVKQAALKYLTQLQN